MAYPARLVQIRAQDPPTLPRGREAGAVYFEAAARGGYPRRAIGR